MKTKSFLLTLSALLLFVGATASAQVVNDRRDGSTFTRGGGGTRITSEPPRSTAPTNLSLKDYLNSDEYRNMEKMDALIVDSEPLAELPPIIVNDEGAFILTSKKVDMTEKAGTDEFFSSSADEDIIFPGRLVWINKSLANGDPVPCGFAPGRVNLTIRLNVGQGYSASAIVKNDYSSVHDQILKWLNIVGEREVGFDANGKASYYSDKNHMAATLNVDADYLSNKCGVHLETTEDELKVISVENFSHTFYVVTAAKIDEDPSSLFGGSVTAGEVKKEVLRNGCPIGMVSSVSYGRRAYRFREFTSKDFTFKGDQSLDFSAGGFSFNSSATEDITSSSKYSNFWAFIQGGNPGDKEIFSDEEIGVNKSSSFMATMRKNSSFSANNPGVALYYTVRFLKNFGTAKRIVTNEYYETTYTPCPKTITFDIRKSANQVAGTSIEFWANYRVIHVNRDKYGKIIDWDILTAPTTKGAEKAETGYVDYTHKVFKQGETSFKKTIPTKDVLDYENCYIYGKILYHLAGNYRSGQSWTKWEQNEYVPLSKINYDLPEGPKIIVRIKGSNYAGNHPYTEFERPE